MVLSHMVSIPDWKQSRIISRAPERNSIRILLSHSISKTDIIYVSRGRKSQVSRHFNLLDIVSEAVNHGNVVIEGNQERL